MPRDSTFLSESRERIYGACGDTQAQCSFGLSNDETYDGTLSTTGVILGRIEQTSAYTVHLNTLLEYLDQPSWQDNLQESVPGVLWRTLVADRDPDGKSPPRWYQRACLYWLTQNGQKGYSEKPLTKSYLKRVRQVVLCRKLFSCTAERNEKYDIGGVGSGDAQPVDIACILFGCSAPVILREDEGVVGGSKVYRLIGECYVHRKMEGELFLKDSRGYLGASVNLHSPLDLSW